MITNTQKLRKIALFSSLLVLSMSVGCNSNKNNEIETLPLYDENKVISENLLNPQINTDIENIKTIDENTLLEIVSKENSENTIENIETETSSILINNNSDKKAVCASLPTRFSCFYS